MIVLYPALLLAAIGLALTRERDDGRGWAWFAAWCVAGAAFFFSLLTGLSIGLLLLPFAGAALILVAVRSPHLAESFGFLCGVGLVAIAVAGLNWGEVQTEPWAWLAVGAALAAASVAAYALGVRECR